MINCKWAYLQQHLALQEDQDLQGIRQDPFRERNEMNQCLKKKRDESVVLHTGIKAWLVMQTVI